MTKKGLQVAYEYGNKLPHFGSHAEAERELFARRDRLLEKLQRATSGSQVRLDNSPETLKDLERFYFDLLQKQGFASIGFSREEFENAISMYLGAVFVANVPLFQWFVQEFAFVTGRYEIGVGRAKFNIMLSKGADLATRAKNKSHQSLWKDYMRFSAPFLTS